MENILELTKYQKAATRKNTGNKKKLDSSISLSLPGLREGRPSQGGQHPKAASGGHMDTGAAPVAPAQSSVLGKRSKTHPHSRFLMAEFPLVSDVLSCVKTVSRALLISRGKTSSRAVFHTAARLLTVLQGITQSSRLMTRGRGQHREARGQDSSLAVLHIRGDRIKLWNWYAACSSTL